MTNHLLFDLASYLTAALTTLYVRRWATRQPYPIPERLRGVYFFVLTNGVIIGSLLFGTLNLHISGIADTLGKSILGAIVGGIIAAEVFKAANKLSGSTGVWLVPGLCLGIAVGRLGCFYGGLADHTYGVASTVPWAVDFGDAVMRHPVQLYEALAMAPAFAVSLWLSQRQSQRWLRQGFYWFALYYATQRFAWEFFKPYADLGLGLQLNLFHLLCLALAGYALVMLQGARHQPMVSQP